MTSFPFYNNLVGSYLKLMESLTNNNLLDDFLKLKMKISSFCISILDYKNRLWGKNVKISDLLHYFWNLTLGH